MLITTAISARLLKVCPSIDKYREKGESRIRVRVTVLHSDAKINDASLLLYPPKRDLEPFWETLKEIQLRLRCVTAT